MRCSWLAVMVLVLALAAPARASTVDCAALAEAPAASGEAVAWALPIVGALVDAEARLDLRAPARVELIADAPAGAWFCAERDVVYVSAALVEWAWIGRAVDGRDFLGFVVAHELAHRRFDPGLDRFAPEVDRAPADPGCPALDVPREARADRRAAFLLATARDPLRLRGFSPFGLARREALQAFFHAELGWPRECPALTARVAAVDGAIARMETLARRYDAALALALAGADEAALALLAEVHAGAGDPEWDAMPELELVAALVHLGRAGRVGWCSDDLARAPLDPSPCTLACAPTLPRYPWIAPRDRFGDRAPDRIDRPRELADARAAVDAAVAGGLAPERARTVSACIAYLDGDPERALALGDRSQRPLFELQRRLLETPDPVLSGGWIEAIADLARDLPPGGEVRRAVASWLGEPTPVEPPRLDRPPVATLRVPSLEAFAALAPCDPAAPTVDLGRGATLREGPGCVRVARAGGRVVTLREATPSGLASDVAAWRAHCELAERGRTDDGAVVLGGRCPSWDGPGEGWLVFASSPPRVLRVEGLAP